MDAPERGDHSSSERRALRQDDLLWRLVGDEVVLLDLKARQYLSSNPVGAALVARLAEGATQDELVAFLVEEYEVDETTASTDVEAFLGVMEEHDLIVRSDPS